MNTKPFSKEDYKESDRKCKIVASRFLIWDGRFFKIESQDRKNWVEITKNGIKIV